MDVIGEYVRLQPAGRSLKGLCPFHGERTPSFHVSRERQLFHCFGCGVGGDVFSFIMKIENVDFLDAARILAERAGIDWPGNGQAGVGGPAHSRLLEALDLAARYYQYVLRQAPPAHPVWRYIQGRGIDQTSLQRFGLGYAPPDGDLLWRALERRGFTAREAEAAGLILPGQGGQWMDRFRGRLMFPIRDHRGRVIAFGGRVLGDGEPKYLNSPETPLFHKGRHLFALDLAQDAIRSRGLALVVEGYMDVLTCHQFGAQYVVATLGTAFTREQGMLLGRYTQEVVLSFDADPAGRQAVFRALQSLAGQALTARVLLLPAGEDPDSFLHKRGREAWEERVEQALPLPEYLLGTVLSGRDLQDVQQKVQAEQEVLPILAALVKAVEREAYIEWAAARLQVPAHALRSDLRRYLARQRNGAPAEHTIDRGAHNSYEYAPKAAPGWVGQPDWEKQLLVDLIRQPQALSELVHYGGADLFENAQWRQLAEAMIRQWEQAGRLDGMALQETLDTGAAPALAAVLAAADAAAPLPPRPLAILRQLLRQRTERRLEAWQRDFSLLERRLAAVLRAPRGPQVNEPAQGPRSGDQDNANNPNTLVAGLVDALRKYKILRDEAYRVAQLSRGGREQH